MKKMVVLAVMLSVCVMAFAGPAMANPATIPIKLENPQFGLPCPVPPDLGFVPLASFSETNIMTAPSGEAIGSTAGCQFLRGHLKNPA
jgi:hypothetical protein